MATLSHAELAKKLMECAILVKRGEETPLIQETIQGLLEYAPKTVRITQEPKSSTVVAQAQKAVSNIKQKLKRDQHEEAPTSTRSTKTVIRSKPAFHRPSYQSNSALLVNGWIDQWRKSKFRSVWKQILASIVEARKPGQETTLWIQRQVETKDGQVELEALHQLPVVWIQQLEYPYAGDPLQFCISVHNLHDEFIFRTSSVEATQNWVSTIQSIVSNTKSKSTVAVPVTTINGLPARDTNRDTVVRPVRSDESNHPNDDDNDKPSLSKHRMSITELRAIAHGVGHSTAGMERSELETLVQHIAASSGINNAAAKTDPRTMTTSPVPPAPRSAPVPTTTTTTTAAPANLPPRSVTPTLPKQRLPISELRALAHGAGISTVGMERQDLERVVAQLGRQQQNSAPPSQSSAPAPEPTQSQEEEDDDDDEELQEQIKREEEEQRKQALAKERNRVEEERKERKRIVEERKQREAELQREQQQREQQEQADREQAEELRRLEQERLQVEEQAHQKRVAELQARKEQEQLRQQAAEQARKEEQKMRQQQAAYQEQQRQWQQQQAVAEEQRRQQEAATRRLQESNRQAQARAQQYAAPPHPQSHPQQHPQNPHAAQQQAWHHHQQQQQQQHRPQPPPNGHHPPHPPTPSKYAKIAQQQQQQQQAGTQAIKHHILVTWALQPPLLQILRPIETLLSTIHTVFPPHCGVPGHAHFAKWNTIALQDVYDPSNSRPDDEKLKKCVRKLRFFLHPDKLPKDLDTEQTFVCKLLWDVTNDAWEEHKNRQDDLGWIQS